jgi:hypothetical protein
LISTGGISHGWFVYEVNPALVAGFKKRSLNGPKRIILILGLLPNGFASDGLNHILTSKAYKATTSVNPPQIAPY